MGKIGKHLWRPPIPIPLLRDGSAICYSYLLRAQYCQVLSNSKDGDSTTPLGSMLQSLTTLREKRLISVSIGNLLYFSLCPLSCLIVGHHWAPSSLLNFHQESYEYIDNVPLSILRLRLNSPHSFGLSSNPTSCSPLPINIHVCLLDSLGYVHVCLVLGSAELKPALQGCLTMNDKNHLHYLPGSTLPMKPRMLFVVLATREYCYLMFNLVSTSIPMSFSGHPAFHLVSL